MKSSKKKSGPDTFPARFSLGARLLGIPLKPEQEITIGSETEHALFLQCSEVYRVIDLLHRKTDEMIESYSKYRTRDPFRDALILRFFGVDETILAKIHPEVEALILSAFNRLHELRLKLAHVDSLPFTVKEELTQEIGHLTRIWEDLRSILKARLGWDLASIAD